MGHTATRRSTSRLAGCLAIALAAGVPVAATAARAADPEPWEVVSVTPAGEPATANSIRPDVSTDGRFVAFSTVAADVLPGDERPERCFEDEDGSTACDELSDVVVRDRVGRTSERISVSSDEVPGDRDSGGISLAGPAISGDGGYVAFASDAANLVPGDTNGRADVFVRDRVAGTTERVSVTTRGRQGAGDSGRAGVAISRDGRLVAFETSAPDLASAGPGVMVHDRVTRKTIRVGRGQGAVDLSADGRVVVFTAYRGSRFNGGDVYAHDLGTGRTERVSVDARGRPATEGNGGFQPAVSGSGRFVAFTSTAPLSRRDANAVPDVYLRDRRRGTTRRVSVKPSGRESMRASYASDISSDGRVVAMISDAGLVRGDRGHDQDLFVRDVRSGVTRKLTEGEGDPGFLYFSQLRLSPDGGTAAFVDERGAHQVVVRRPPRP